LFCWLVLARTMSHAMICSHAMSRTVSCYKMDMGCQMLDEDMAIYICKFVNIVYLTYIYIC